jgi:putative transposase
VRAALVKHPRKYGWSSYRANAEGEASDLVVPHAHYLALGATAEPRMRAYLDLV